MRVYLSGPMTGLPEFNYPAFHRAAVLWRAAGHDVVNPAENAEGDSTLPYATYLRYDIAALLTVDAIVVLPGWEKSRGATLENAIADVLELPRFEAAGPVPLVQPSADRAVKDQPAPARNDGPAVWDLVIADMRERDLTGRARYGTPLQAHNGRDALVDGYQEALDLVVYLRQAIAERAPVIDASHIERQRRWSEATFGPGRRTKGVVEHIRKELVEIEADPTDLSEWIDVVILGLDGAWRAGHKPQAILDAIVAKQTTNEQRTWPDWRAASEDHAIEHVRG